MSETAKYKTTDQDQVLGIINKLAMLEVDSLSYLQLIRLQKALKHACKDIGKETARRAEADSSGDTVQFEAPQSDPDS